MVNFIMDPRLVHWYAQNFDLLGCGAFTGNSPIAPGHPAARKVSALPIGGEGLHRLSCTEVEESRRVAAVLRLGTGDALHHRGPHDGLLRWGGSRSSGVGGASGGNEATFLHALGANRPWQQRKVAVLEANAAGARWVSEDSHDKWVVGCAGQVVDRPCWLLGSYIHLFICLILCALILLGRYKMGRSQAAAALAKQPNKAVVPRQSPEEVKAMMNLTRRHNLQSTSSRGGPDLSPRQWNYYTTLARNMFVLCPPGHGVDTHRFWEALALGSVPVVLASPLDWLLDQYPIVILQSWGDVAAKGAVEAWRQAIEERWGKEPFSDNVRRRLTLGHFRKAIFQGRSLHRPAPAPPPPLFYDGSGGASRQRRGAFPTCNLPSCTFPVGNVYSRKSLRRCREESMAWKGGD
jgi:hypothetical protein